MSEHRKLPEGFEGAMIDESGKKTDELFHRDQMGLSEKADAKQSKRIEEVGEGLLEEQAIRAERIDRDFARRTYEALMKRFPQSGRRDDWEKKVAELKG